MTTAGAELRRASLRGDFLHPFRSFSTSQVSRRVEPSQDGEKTKREESNSNRNFLAQLRRSFKFGHRSSSSSLASSPQPQLRQEASAKRKKEEDNINANTSVVEGGGGGRNGILAQLRRSFTTLGHRSSSSASLTTSHVVSKDSISQKRGSSDQGAWGKRVKQGLAKPLKVVSDSYVGCMMSISEDPRVETLEGMGFSNPNASHEHAFQTSIARRYDRSVSAPSEDLLNSHFHH